MKKVIMMIAGAFIMACIAVSANKTEKATGGDTIKTDSLIPPVVCVVDSGAQL